MAKLVMVGMTVAIKAGTRLWIAPQRIVYVMGVSHIEIEEAILGEQEPEALLFLGDAPGPEAA